MRYWALLFLVALIGLTSCKKGCYRCASNTVCTIATKGKDSLDRCFNTVTANDSLKKYTDQGYHCTIYSGVQYQLNVCDADSLMSDLKRDGYSCNKE